MKGIGVLLLIALMMTMECQSAKILVVFPFPAKSHSNLGDGFVRLLSAAGHEVTYVTPYPVEKPASNVHQVDVSSNLEVDVANKMNITAILEKEFDMTDTSTFFPILFQMVKKTFENENFQHVLNDQSQEFDVVILEYLFSEIYIGLSAVFNCPYIWFSSVEPHSLVLKLIDEPLNPSYNSNCFEAGVPPFSFAERIRKLFTELSMSLSLRLLFTPYEAQEYENIFKSLVEKKGRSLPPYEVLRFNASIMLGNSHVSLGQATKLPQSYKPIGGYHIDPNVKALPEDLKKIMDSSEHGVIYFSMGSNLKSKDLPASMKNGLIKMFGQLKQTVLWKFEEAFPDVPKNVLILKWAPQPSILAHPNCKLFITHGGLLSTTEAVHFGVPIIGIPVFADQFTNVERAEIKGFAKQVKFTYSLVDHLKVAIDEMLVNPKYYEKAKELSMIYHDRPVSPGAELVHWVEHVVRTRGAPHLRSPALHVPWYQKMYLDLAVLVVALLLLIVYVFKVLFCKRKNIKVSKKRN